MNKYNLHDNVIFTHNGQTLEGEIIGISDANNPTYCIYIQSYEEDPIAQFITEGDLRFFDFKSQKMISLVGKRAFWKSSIVSLGKMGANCQRCKEHNAYIAPNSNYKCWSCTNYPYR